jgi:two-component system chemotaxis response regulator CheY
MFPPNTKFLVVDDYSTMRKIVKKILGDLGYSRIEEAEDGKPALEKVNLAMTANDPFGCVISDWNMPGMSGLDLLKGIRGNPATAKIPVILATAEGDQKNVVEAVKAGVDNYVVKPFTAATLAEKMKKAFDKAQTQNKRTA